jgi:hypothetical protein
VSTLQEVELQSKGLVLVVETWAVEKSKIDDQMKRSLSTLENLVVRACGHIEEVARTAEADCRDETFPEALIVHFVGHVQEMLIRASKLNSEISRFELSGYFIRHTDDLRNGIARLRSILSDLCPHPADSAMQPYEASATDSAFIKSLLEGEREIPRIPIRPL